VLVEKIMMIDALVVVENVLSAGIKYAYPKKQVD
jgi:hypothetical protein